MRAPQLATAAPLTSDVGVRLRRLSGRQEMVDHPANLRLERGRPREIAGGVADGRARQQHLRLRGLVRSGPSLVGARCGGGPDHFAGRDRWTHPAGCPVALSMGYWILIGLSVFGTLYFGGGYFMNARKGARNATFLSAQLGPALHLESARFAS